MGYFGKRKSHTTRLQAAAARRKAEAIAIELAAAQLLATATTAHDFQPTLSIKSAQKIPIREARPRKVKVPVRRVPSNFASVAAFCNSLSA